jgi:Fic family protein/DNA-binding transcriptional ArsR family regulator
MPKKIRQEEIDEILAVFTKISSPMSVGEVAEHLATPLEKRTLQRRLASLEDRGKLKSSGQKRAKRYRIRRVAYDFTPKRSVVSEPATVYGAERSVVLSENSREIRQILKRPVSKRKPVGYDAQFLADYIPNQTCYLPLVTREKLARLGQVGASQLPAGTYMREVISRLLIDLSWNSSRLEGNTYTLLETERLLNESQIAEGKQVEETQMVVNHKAAIEMLSEDADILCFNRYTILNLHALLSENLMKDRHAVGSLREIAVGIGASVYHPLSVPQMIEPHFDEILSKTEAIDDPFEQAFFIMVHLPYLQPFEDVNKRTSRLAANIPLVRHNLCPLSFIGVPKEDYILALLAVYELNRVDYLHDVFVSAYEQSAARYGSVRQELGEPDPFHLRYRQPIKETVREVVLQKLSKAEAITFIRTATGMIQAEDRAEFTENVEEELRSLHIGNIARFRLRPANLEEWQAGW